MMRILCSVIQRDMLLFFRRQSDLVNPLLFFMVVVCLFPLALEPKAELLQLIAPGVLWVAALLAGTLSLDTLFRSDYEDGTLEQMAMSQAPMWIIALGKSITHWMVTGLPLVLITPVFAVMLNVPASEIGTLMLTVLLGTPILSLVGAIGVALTLDVQRGGALVALIILPLYVPVLIFGANTVNSAMLGLPITGQLFILAAMLVFSVTTAPFAIAAALKVSLS